VCGACGYGVSRGPVGALPSLTPQLCFVCCAEVGLVFQFLFALNTVFEGYFGEEYDDDTIRSSFTLVYELFDGAWGWQRQPCKPPPPPIPSPPLQPPVDLDVVWPRHSPCHSPAHCVCACWGRWRIVV
jgi:hypothetical protein